MIWCGISILLTISINGAKSQSDCKTPHGAAGRCVSINDCASLLKFVRYPLSPQSIGFLRKSQCGFTDLKQPRVCCSDPPACVTPGGRAGTCIIISRCPAIFSVLTGPQPLAPAAIAYMHRSVCAGLVEQAVCCGDPQVPSAEPPPPTGPCGISAGTERITNGQEPAIDELPWLAIVEYEPTTPGGPNELLCGASLIHPRFVLTAAHCIVGQKPVQVRLGEHDINSVTDCQVASGGHPDCNDPIVIIPIEKFVVHEHYLPRAINQENDIAIIKLAEAAPYTDFIRHICLPKNDITKATLADEVNFTIAGWGHTDKNSHGSNVKQSAEVPFKSLDNCRRAYEIALGKSLQLTERHVCAGGANGTDTCRGDSGGPMIWRNPNSSIYEVHGVISFGLRVCGTSTPSIFTKVYKYIDWVRTKMND